MGVFLLYSPSFLNDDLLQVDKIGGEQSLEETIEEERVFHCHVLRNPNTIKLKNLCFCYYRLYNQ